MPAGVVFPYLPRRGPPRTPQSPTRERRVLATGHVAWLVEQITVRNILPGYAPKDPLIQWVEQHFSTHKFVAFYRSPRIYDAFFPRETIPPPRQPDEADAETLWSPFHPYYRC